MRAVGFVDAQGNPDWKRLADELFLAEGTMTNIRCGTYVPGARTRKHFARVLASTEQELWPDVPVENQVSST